jgi:hypothetical protein
LTRVGRTAAIVAAACLVGAPAAFAASALRAVQSGWWNEASIGSLAPPSVTSPGQLQVSDDSRGPLSFAAVRVAVPAGTPGTDILRMTLPIPSGAVGTPAVSACPTTSSWHSGADQPSGAAPGYSCAGRQANGSASATNETWSIPVSWAAHAGVAVALVPTPGSTLPFSVTYTAPGATSFVLVSAPRPAPSSTPGPGPAGPAPASPAAATGSQSPGTATAPVLVTGGSALAVPVAGAVALAVRGSPSGASSAPGPSVGTTSSPTGTGPSTAPTPGSGPTAVAAPISSAPGGGSGAGDPGSGRAGRVMAFGLLVILMLALVGLAARPERVPRLLGSVGAARRATAPTAPGAVPVVATAAGGIGRFARPRTGPPRRL